MPQQSPALPWLALGEDFPLASRAWNASSPAPGLLAAGGGLDVDTLRRAYGQGIFPWYSAGQPVLWWSPDPRMVLDVFNFRIHPSFRKTLQRFRKTVNAEIRIDSAFEQVIQACSANPREGQAGTWIGADILSAYADLHRAGLAHSVETWVNGALVGGLYCVALGRSVFGESMFSRAANASKIALAGLVGFCRQHGIVQIDCQQNTPHLASLGASEMPRAEFLQQVALGLTQQAPVWQFEPQCWDELLPVKAAAT